MVIVQNIKRDLKFSKIVKNQSIVPSIWERVPSALMTNYFIPEEGDRMFVRNIGTYIRGNKFS